MNYDWHVVFNLYLVVSLTFYFHFFVMCWIFWYTGSWDTVSVLLHGLQRLEYRWYDSAWLYVTWKDWSHLERAVGKVSELTSRFDQERDVSSYTCWIAHTRWATHGGVTESNTHPHTSNDWKRIIVHNGIIENYSKLKKELIAKWYTFSSETDTEVIANLLQEHATWSFVETVKEVQSRIRWAYAVLILHVDSPNEMVALRLWSPLLFAYNDTNEYFFSSDAQALAWYAKKLIYLEDGDLLHFHTTDAWKDYTIFHNGEVTKRDSETFDHEAMEASKWDFKHFMLKEIYEQPNVLSRVCKWRVSFEDFTLHADAFHGMHQEDYKKIVTVACGTSNYVWRLWTYWIQQLAKIEAQNEIASEYENKPFFVDPRKLHIFVSQSGETADTLSVLKMLQEQWGKSFGVVNVVWSSIARLTDSWFFARAGTEIGVASTKAFTSQSLCMLLLALFLWKRRGMRLSLYQKIMRELEHLPAYIETVLDQSDQIRWIAMQLMQYKDFFFLGRGYQVPIAYESSLKFKEITYLHSEAYPAGELKHWPLALIDENVPTIFILPHDEMYEANISSMQEIKARKWKICVIWDRSVEWSDRQISIPETCDELYPFLTVVAGQLLAYHLADLLENDIDKPRNLAKSVTVK